MLHFALIIVVICKLTCYYPYKMRVNHLKFNFRTQQYQTDAVDAVVKVFKGQGFHDKISYIHDLGKMKHIFFVAETKGTTERLELRLLCRQKFPVQKSCLMKCQRAM